MNKQTISSIKTYVLNAHDLGLNIDIIYTNICPIGDRIRDIELDWRQSGFLII